MQVKEILLETPYSHEGTMKRPNFGTTYTSDTSISRLYEPMLTTMTIDGKDVRFYVLKAGGKVIGVVDANKPDGEKTNQHVFSLMFKPKHTLINVPKEFKGKILQVNKVATDPKYEGEGIASLIYATLVKNGIIILSDTSQFDDGKMLWKKMARKAKVSDYSIFILDDEYGFQHDKDGKSIEYNASNIDDAKIWTKGQDLAGEHILLVMKTK